MHRATQWPWESPLVRWHGRHVIVIWVGVRLLVLVAVSMPSFAPHATRDSPITIATGTIATMVSFIVVMLLAEIDRRRIGAPLLFANLGYSAHWSAITTGAIVVAAEVLLRVVIGIAAGQPE